MEYDVNQFVKDLSEFEISLSDGQIQQFITYYELSAGDTPEIRDACPTETG